MGCCIHLPFLIPKHPWQLEGSCRFSLVVGRHVWCVLPAFCWVSHMFSGCKVWMQSRWVYRWSWPSTSSFSIHTCPLPPSNWLRLFSNPYKYSVFSWLFFLLTLPMKMEQTECSETLAYEIQMPGNHQKEISLTYSREQSPSWEGFVANQEIPSIL